MDAFDRAMGDMNSSRDQGRVKRERDRDHREEPDHKRRPSGFGYEDQSARSDSFKPVNDRVGVQLNMFKLDISQMPPRIQRLVFETKLVNPGGNVYDVNTGAVASAGDVNAQFRRRAQDLIFNKFFEKHRNLFDNRKSAVVAYDSAATLYVSEKFYKGEQGKSYEDIFKKEDFADNEWVVVSKLCRKRGAHFAVKLAPTGIVHTSGDALHEEANRMELTRCIEIVTSQKLNTSEFYQFGNSTFPWSQAPTSQPDAVSEIRSGFNKVAKLAEGRGGRKEFFMTIDTKMSPFFRATSLLKFIASKVDESRNGGRGGGGGRGGFGGGGRGGFGGGGGRGGRDNYHDRRGDHGGYRDDRGGRGDYGGHRDDRGGRGGRDYRDDRRDRGLRDEEVSASQVEDILRALDLRNGTALRRSISDAMKGLYTEATHLAKDSNRIVVISGLADGNAENTTFTYKEEGREEREISVAEYFLLKYTKTLKYPKLPLIISKRLKTISYHPIECLNIIPGQRIKISKMTSNVQSSMTGQNACKPMDHVERVHDILVNFLRLEGNAHMDAFGLKLESREPVTMKAKLLAPAKLVFQNNTVMPTQKSVAFGGGAGRFVEPARLKTIALMVFDGCLDERRAEHFCEVLSRCCSDRGIIIDDSHRRWAIKEVRTGDHATIRRKMEQYRDDGTDIVFAICKEKQPQAHDVLKYYEEALGMQTIQICGQSADRMMSGQGGAQTVDNIMRKFNAKCGGTNFFVDLPGQPFCSNQKDLQDKLLKNVQFLGFEISHGASRTIYDRAHNQMDGEPSVVGVSYSLKQSTQLGGFAYLQTAREHKLQHLSDKIPDCVKAFEEHAGKLPSKLVIYRVGTGEGDFRRVMEEVEEIRSSFEKIKPGYSPQLLVIVAQRNSHTRVFPATIPRVQKASEQNVKSGTCIDNGVTSYGMEEFILCSQTPLIGTVRPCKYTILVNEPRWSKNEISHLTYFRAFGHQVSYQPPSVPDVLYAAENLAKRGRNNWIQHKKLENMQAVERRILDLHGELEISDEDLAAAIIQDIDRQMNAMTIRKRNFWA